MNVNTTYTKEELLAMLGKMHQASDAFYFAATRIGNHAFIEFTGLMNEYIKVCEKMLADGEDFTQSNIHGGKPIPDYMIEYMEEKMGCILGRDVTLKVKA